MDLRILYVYPFEYWGRDDFLVSLVRISNYLNSRKKELKGEIQEEYIDLRFENLPFFCPENIEQYREKLIDVLKKIYERFEFNLVAISCFTSFNYINVVEIACTLKKYVSSNCSIVVGGFHVSSCPEDFQPNNFPEYLYETWDRNYTPFDYLVREEGEIPFFKLVKNIMNGSYSITNQFSENCTILEIENLDDLNELPIINLDFFKKYSKVFNNNLNIDFSRGCLFRCKYCSNSTDKMKCNQTVRYKSIKKCIEELEVIRNIKWLSFKELYISDPIFIPKKSLRKAFFELFEKLIEKYGKFPFKIIVFDRIELCSNQDLENYKKFDINSRIGLESCSKTMLFRMGKLMGNNNDSILKSIDFYLEKTLKIIEISNNLDLPITYFYLTGLPGSDEDTIKESRDFFLEKKFDGKSLIEKYKVNLLFERYIALNGSEIYYTSEDLYGTKIHFKEWWKIFDKDQVYYSLLVEPSKNLSFKESIKLNSDYIKEILLKQREIGNPYYSFEDTIVLVERRNKMIDFYENIIENK